MEKSIIVIAATAMEMRAVMNGLREGFGEGFDRDAPAPEPGEAVFGRVRDIPLRFVTSGIGPLAAAHAAGFLAGEGALDSAHCRGVLSLGIAGTYARNTAPIGSVVMATREIWPEYGLFTEEGVEAKALGFPLLGKKDDPAPVWNELSLCPAAALAAMGLNDPSAAPREARNPVFAAGPSVTVATVSGTLRRAEELAARHAGLTENMEGFPLALAAFRAGVPFAEIRAVSNLVGDRRPEAWDIPASLAALSRSASLLFSL